MSEFLPLLMPQEGNLYSEVRPPMMKDRLFLFGQCTFKQQFFLLRLGMNTVLPAFLEMLWFCTIIFNGFLVVNYLTK